MKHEEYVNDLVDLQNKEGKRLSAAAIRGLKKLLRASGGDLRKFVGLLRVTRKVFLRDLARMARQSGMKARKLGRKFGESKLV